jgi:hypothetical protein
VKILAIGALMTSVAFADAVTDWNAIMRNTIASQNALAQARFAAITHLAVFEAVNAISKEYKPYIGEINPQPGASPDAAAVAAAHRVLKTYFPASGASLDADRDRSLAAIPEGASKTEGIAVGEAAAAAMIARRSNDGSASVKPYTPINGVGFWQPTPPAFAPAAFLHWGKVAPFGLNRPEQFRPPPPPALTSRQYARDYNEVKNVGGVLSLERLQDRADVARYASLTSPALLWNSVAVQLATAQRTSLTENARTFALLNAAIADAAVAVFEAKYHYNLWRPVTAIWAGESDGNPRTAADAGFNTFIATPPYPDYPSGFGGLSNAASYVLERTFGSGRHLIALSLPTLPGVTLEYKRLREITDDIADARVYGGIHFRFAQEAAEVLGRRVGQYIMTTHLRCAGANGTCEDFAEASAGQ